MEKILGNIIPFIFNQDIQSQKVHLSYTYTSKVVNSSLNSTLPEFKISTYPNSQAPEPELNALSLNIWVVILCIFVLHVCRQIYLYYRFFSSEPMRPFWKYLSFTKHILPSFLTSVISNIRSINYDFLVKDVTANAALKKIHMMPYRSTFHTYHTDVQGYKGTTFVIAMNTDEKILAFRRILMRFISERLSSGILQQIISEGVQKWVQKGTVDMLDITMFLESLVMRFLYDVDPDEVFTPEQRIKRAQHIYNGTKWVLYDSYRPIGNLFFLLYQATGYDFDPVRRFAIRTITEIWDDAYDRQMQMMKEGKHCLLGAFLEDPALANLDLNFIKANTVGAIMGGQFLTSISNITGMLYSISKGNLPQTENKMKWILQVITDWSPLINILRSYLGFVVILPSTGNSEDLNRSFSLGQRQCPGKGLVLEAYRCMIDLLSKYKFSVECLEETRIRCSLWPFSNPQLKFRII